MHQQIEQFFLQEIHKTQGNLYDTRNSMSINTIEISRNETTIYTTDTDYQQPGKFIVAIDTTQLGCGSSKTLFNGIS